MDSLKGTVILFGPHTSQNLTKDLVTCKNAESASKLFKVRYRFGVALRVRRRDWFPPGKGRYERAHRPPPICVEYRRKATKGAFVQVNRSSLLTVVRGICILDALFHYHRQPSLDGRAWQHLSAG